MEMEREIPHTLKEDNIDLFLQIWCERIPRAGQWEKLLEEKEFQQDVMGRTFEEKELLFLFVSKSVFESKGFTCKKVTAREGRMRRACTRYSDTSCNVCVSINMECGIIRISGAHEKTRTVGIQV